MNIIVDLDNCLAEDQWRLHLIDWAQSDIGMRFHQYHEASLYDPAHNLHLLKPATGVYICTSRPEQYADITLEWLHKHHIQFTQLLMRPQGDHRPSVMVKEAMLARIHVLIHWAVDDRPDVVQMYRKHHIKASILAIHPLEWKENPDGRS